jgi:hypothetical protein
MALSVSKGVALGVTVVRSPSCTLFSSNGKRSGRFRGSPPLKTIRGSPKERTSSSNRNPSSVDNSKGLRFSIAQARQCTHARSQAWVSSQMTRKGASSKFLIG